MPLLSAVLDLAMPRHCVGCGVAGELWCAACRPVPRPVRAEVAGVALVAAVGYADATARALVHFKDRGRWDLAGPLAALLRPALLACARQGAARPGDWVVPVPSTSAAAGRRGGQHVLELARRAARGTPYLVRPALSVPGSVRDSVGLDAAARRANIGGAMRAARAPRSGGRAIVVDDLATTGASVEEACRALRERGWTVLGAAVVAAVPRGPEGRDRRP